MKAIRFKAGLYQDYVKALLIATIILVPSTVYSEGTVSAYVFSDELNVRLSPNKTGTITNKLYYGQRVDVLAIRAGWVRISKFYPGIVEGKGKALVARWVDAKYLQDTKPKERAPVFDLPSIPDRLLMKAIRKSDDFYMYGNKFYRAAEKLISKKRCSIKDFLDMGGWAKSTSRTGVYFTYCGTTRNDRIYLRITDEKLFFINSP